MKYSLTLAALREANLARLPQFRDRKGRICHAQPDGSDWTSAQWLQAVVGELGELANLLKKVDRGDLIVEEAHEAIQKEFADVLIYLDIFALQFRIDLDEAVISKFNEVSERVRANVFLNPQGEVISDPSRAALGGG